MTCLPAILHQLGAFYCGLPSYPQVDDGKKRVQPQTHWYFLPPQGLEQAHSHAAVAATVRALAFVFLLKNIWIWEEGKSSVSFMLSATSYSNYFRGSRQTADKQPLPACSQHLTPPLSPTSSAHKCREHWIKRDWQLQERETSKASYIKHLIMSPEGQPVPGADMRAYMCLLHLYLVTLAELWSPGCFQTPWI